MGRLLRLEKQYAQTYSALKLDRTEKSAVAATTIRLENASSLPGAEDFEALRWPVGVAWARKVRGARLWVLYSFDEHSMTLEDIRRAKPVRVGG
ncbi:MAG TPA: hypothetical protein VF103_01260 [Polyangiaceae bacterium]